MTTAPGADCYSGLDTPVVAACCLAVGDRVLYDGAWCEIAGISRAVPPVARPLELLLARGTYWPDGHRWAVRPLDLICVLRSPAP